MPNQPMPGIQIQFPKGNVASRVFYNRLVGMLIDTPQAAMVDDDLTLTAQHTIPGALPQITLCETSAPHPQLVFVIPDALDFMVGDLTVRSEHGSATTAISGATPTKPPTQTMTLEALNDKLHIHITRIDHVGVNFPAAALDQATWERLIAALAARANVYRYQGETCFIVPATPQEYAADITSFAVSRDPKFELVYDASTMLPILQIDITTNLTRAELDALLPEPLGYVMPNRAAYCRTVHVATPWPGLLARCDIRDRRDEPSTWDTGAWLVEQGGRIRP